MRKILLLLSLAACGEDTYEGLPRGARTCGKAWKGSMDCIVQGDLYRCLDDTPSTSSYRWVCVLVARSLPEGVQP